jgi:G patch domain-containing protein 1
MDEEDKAAMREDRTLSNTDTFRSDRIGSTKDEIDARTPAALESLIAPARSSIGEKLLQKQGWRPGQGIGPRVTLKRLKRQEAKLQRNGVAVGHANAEDADMDDADGEAAKHTYAPRDVKLLVFAAKEDQQGLGYVPGMGGGLSRAPAPKLRANHVQVDEDDDVYGGYEGGPSRSNRHYAFDDLEDEPITIGASSAAGPSFSRPHQAITVSSDIDTTRYHDGRPVLPGFELDPLGAPTDKWYVMIATGASVCEELISRFELPDIPADWRPRPARVWGTTRKWDQEPGQAMDTSAPTIRGAPGQPLSIHQVRHSISTVQE